MNRILHGSLALLLLATLCATSVAHAEISECDRLASHPEDPDKVLPGLHRPQMDLLRAEAACRAAVAADPRSGRALYQLGRVLFYGRHTDESLTTLEKAVAVGYRQAIFVLGYVYFDGTQAPRDDCRAAALWQRSVGLDHPWTGYYLVSGWLDGRFEKCDIKLSEADIERYFEFSRDHLSVGASEGRIEALEARLARRRAAAKLATAPAAAVVLFDPAKYSQTVTECDRLASHPEDPYAVAPGLEKPQIDLPRAIEACRTAVRTDPRNPRLNYLLGRVLGYSGRGAEGIANRQAAVDADYPQALFVIGYITLFGMNQQPQDTCRGGELIRRSALQNRLAGQLGFPRYVLDGKFKECPNLRQDPVEMLSFIKAARAQIKGDYYQTLLADMLEAQLSALPR
jgi:TPR repeat protein